MGRKIPSKKHRGVKDPLVQQARREQSLKSKINAPPKDPDEQPVPSTLTRLFAFQDKDKNKKDKQKKVKRLNHNANNKQGHKSGGGHNPITKMKRLPGESGRDFSLRINSAVKALHNPLEDLDYPDDEETEDVKGAFIAAQRERRARKLKKAKKGTEDPGGPQLNRNQRLALKKKEKKMKVEEEANKTKCEVMYERVSFGDVTHAPPALQHKHKRTDGGTNTMGRRGLLLAGLLDGRSSGGPAAVAADAARRERARLDAIAAYRALKANKTKPNKVLL